MTIQVRPIASDFEQIGPPKWDPNGWDMDRLTIPYRGPSSKLDAFIATLVPWAASAVDANMFLEDWPNDGDPVHPTVTLVYTGKKGGILPQGRNESGTAVQNCSTSLGTEGLQGPQSTSIEVSYYSPTKQITSIVRAEAAGAQPSDPTGNIVLFAALVNANPYPVDGLLAYFRTLISTVNHSEELVPGQYWRSTWTKNKILTRGSSSLVPPASPL